MVETQGAENHIEDIDPDKGRHDIENLPFCVFSRARRIPAKHIRKAIYIKPFVMTIISTSLQENQAPSHIKISQTADALDPEARCVRNGNFLFVEDGTAIDGIFTAKDGSIKINAGNDFFGTG